MLNHGRSWQIRASNGEKLNSRKENWEDASLVDPEQVFLDEIRVLDHKTVSTSNVF